MSEKQKTSREMFTEMFRERWIEFTPAQAFRDFWDKRRNYPDWGHSWAAAFDVITEKTEEEKLTAQDVEAVIEDFRNTIKVQNMKIGRLEAENLRLKQDKVKIEIKEKKESKKDKGEEKKKKPKKKKK